ncbi:MAG: sigma 54-interacting transcriptional regulator [Thermodesulfobacteriota bacterium]
MQKQAEDSLQERLQFERLLSDLSARFVNLPNRKVDKEIRQGLKLIVESLGIDRSSIAQFSADMKTLRFTHTYAAAGVPPMPAVVLDEEQPWYTEKIRQGETVVMDRISDLPDEASTDRLFLQGLKTKSNLIIPLAVGGSPLGLLGFGATKRERTWPDELVQRLKLVGEVFANALMRQRTDRELQERLKFERLLSGLSARFVNLPNQQVDKEIEQGLKLIVRSLGIDRSSVAQFSPDMKTLKVTHTYAPARVPIMPPVILNDEQPWITEKIRRGETVVIERIGDLPDEAVVDKRFLLGLETKSSLIIPLAVGGSPLGLFGSGAVKRERTWPEDLVQRLKLVGEVFANALMRQRTEEELHRAFTQIKELKDRLEAENVYLREEMDVRYSHEEIVGRSRAIKSVLRQAEQVAGTDSTVLIMGETGTGKELLARAIHNLSSRNGRAMVKVNCAALPPTLVESELFGREKGAYTGASTRQLGRFEMADGSTIFLDEISELSLEVQAKFLRVLQEGQFERLGRPNTIKVDVRVIAATNQDLGEAVRRGRFREDLFYRLNVFPISMPPLRERLEDIPPLVWAFVHEFGKTMGKGIESIPRRSMDSLMRYPWPGNVRELRNVIERAVILSKGSTLSVELPKAMNILAPSDMRLVEVERSHILEVLNKTGWRVSGKKGAAEILGLKPTTLESRMKKLGIKRKKA